MSSSGHRLAVWEWLQVTLLVTNLAWTTLCLGGFRPETMVVTCVLTGLLLAAHLLACADAAGLFAWFSAPDAKPPSVATTASVPPGGFHPAGWLLLPFLIYAAANVQWVTPVDWIGWRDWFGWAQLAAVFWVVLNGVRTRAGRTTLLAALLVLAFTAVMLGCYQRFGRPDWLMMGRTQVPQFVGRASGPFGIPNSLAALLLLVLPATAALALRRGASAVQRVLFGYLALVFAFGLGLTVSRGAWLSLAVVALGWPLFGGGGPARRRILRTAAVGLALAIIGTTAFYQSDLVRERLIALKRDKGEYARPILWQGAWKIAQEQPTWGSGAGSYALAFEKHRPASYQHDPIWAHNDYLNTLSDYGWVGFVLWFGGWAVIGWTAVRRGRGGGAPCDHLAADGASGWSRGSAITREAAAAIDTRMVRQGLAAGLVAFGLQLWVDFHFKIPALALAFATAAALYVQSAWPRRESVVRSAARGAAGWGCFAGAVGVLLGTVWFILPRYRAEALRYDARRSVDQLAIKQARVEDWAPVLTVARAALQRAVRIDAANGAAWADLSYVTALRAWVEPARIDALALEAEQAAARALKCSKADPEFWIRRGVAVDMRRHHLEAGAAFAQALKLAPARAGVWFHHAFHLSLIPSEQARALEAVEYCLRLDAGNREAQALRQRLTARQRAP